MCGIAVMVGLHGTPADRSVVERMSKSIQHRGPDEDGLFIDGSVGLGFRRLAILDLSPAAHQPMLSEDGQLVLVFNGEIFNYVELRQELQTLGHTFRSTGDTEVLLHAYQEWGQECLHKLNGMWAFVIYDLQQGKLFGARDRFGIKPLYQYSDENYVLLGSEIKAIRASGLYKGGTNWGIVSKYLLQSQLDESNQSFYNGIDQIPPGNSFELDLQGRFKQNNYWSLNNLQANNIEDPVQAFADNFEDAVKLRMRSDVPIGVCLSGGLDSTSIICAAARLKGVVAGRATEPLMGFSYVADEFDESSYISDTIEQTQAHMKQIETHPLQLWEKLGKVLWFHDEPIHTMAAMIGFELMGLVASNGIRVALTGQGADETIAGYPSYFQDYWYTLLRSGSIGKSWREIRAYTLEHGDDQRQLFRKTVRRAFRAELRRVPVYQRLSRWKQQKSIRENSWFTTELTEHLIEDGALDTDVRLNAVLRRSVECTPLPLYLRIEDRNSMAHSVEARLPFLDYRLVSLLFHLPAHWKIRGPWNKYILREAMRQRIPESVRARVDKMGFPTPSKQWFANALYEPLQDLLHSQEARERGIYNLSTICKDLERHRQDEVDISSGIFNVAQFEIWSGIQKAGVS